MSNWLEASEWKRVQQTVPITCVDVLPVRAGRAGVIERIGLIFRDTPHQGRRWCVVGGRLWRDESIAEAAARQLRTTLGERVRFHIAPDVQPAYVAQYFTSSRPVGSIDPRQHAVTLNLCVLIEGEVTPQGEAIRFNWFEPAELPPRGEFGFGQDQVVEAILRDLGGPPVSFG